MILDLLSVLLEGFEDEAYRDHLMGNRTIAERTFRHTPEVMLYAPLPTLIWEHLSGDAWHGHGDPQIALDGHDRDPFAHDWMLASFQAGDIA